MIDGSISSYDIIEYMKKNYKNIEVKKILGRPAILCNGIGVIQYIDKERFCEFVDYLTYNGIPIEDVEVSYRSVELGLQDFLKDKIKQEFKNNELILATENIIMFIDKCDNITYTDVADIFKCDCIEITRNNIRNTNMNIDIEVDNIEKIYNYVKDKYLKQEENNIKGLNNGTTIQRCNKVY